MCFCFVLVDCSDSVGDRRLCGCNVQRGFAAWSATTSGASGSPPATSSSVSGSAGSARICVVLPASPASGTSGSCSQPTCGLRAEACRRLFLLPSTGGHSTGHFDCDSSSGSDHFDGTVDVLHRSTAATVFRKLRITGTSVFC